MTTKTKRDLLKAESPHLPHRFQIAPLVRATDPLRLPGLDFWEGNILFYSDQKRRLSEANVPLREFKAARRMR